MRENEKRGEHGREQSSKSSKKNPLQSYIHQEYVYLRHFDSGSLWIESRLPDRDRKGVHEKSLNRDLESLVVLMHARGSVRYDFLIDI